MKEIQSRSFAVDNNGILQGKWLEPIGLGAICFNQILKAKAISASDLIGIDYNPNDIETSIANIDECKVIYPDSTFIAEDWNDFCYSYSDSDIRYIIYDLYTSTHGDSFVNNMTATMSLVDKCLDKLGQVIVVINADLKVMSRQRKTYKEFEKLLISIFSQYPVRYSKLDINDTTIYKYKNSDSSDDMGTVIVEFFRK